MHSDHDSLSALDPFIDEGWISEVLYQVKSGKEATVFCCRGGERASAPLVAAKVYRPIEERGFRNDAAYLEGRLHMARNGRARRAVTGKTSFGRAVQYATWLVQEWETMRRLHEAGAAIPEPLASGEQAILMSFLGDESAPAPMLHEVRLDRRAASDVIDEILWNIELMLDRDCVHGDLSAYNIMYHADRPVIIDFPQAVDPRLNRNGCALLGRDVERVCAWAEKRGVSRPAGRITTRLWSSFVMGQLG